jgi:CRP/FNR family transcriptional regulator
MKNVCIIHNSPLEGKCPAEGLVLDVPDNAERHFLPGEVIFEEGGAITGVYCIHSGRVALMKHHPLHGDLLAYIAEAGDLPGMPGVVTEDHYLYTAVALSDVSACFITREDFLRLIREQPAIALRAMQQISKRIDWAERELEGEE